MGGRVYSRFLDESGRLVLPSQVQLEVGEESSPGAECEVLLTKSHWPIHEEERGILLKQTPADGYNSRSWYP